MLFHLYVHRWQKIQCRRKKKETEGRGKAKYQGHGFYNNLNDLRFVHMPRPCFSVCVCVFTLLFSRVVEKKVCEIFDLSLNSFFRIRDDHF